MSFLVSKMSLPMKIMSLIKNVRDPSMRIDIASTINYLADLYSIGKISEEELLNDLIEICQAIIIETNKKITKEEAIKLAEKEANEILNLIKITRIRKRISTKRGFGFELM